VVGAQDVIEVAGRNPQPAELMILGYNRKVLGQTGTGHFSPVGGYHPGQDMALIMDVARFKCECRTEEGRGMLLSTGRDMS
jgi:glutathione gamma-glutamylcysteinyltransferase